MLKYQRIDWGAVTPRAQCYQLVDGKHKLVTFNFEERLIEHAKSINFGSGLVSSTPGVQRRPFGIRGKVKVKTPNFRQRCREGEIIVNPYTIYSLTVETERAAVYKSSVRAGSFQYTSWNAMSFIPWVYKSHLAQIHGSPGLRAYVNYATAYGGIYGFDVGNRSAPIYHDTFEERSLFQILGLSEEQLGMKYLERAQQFQVNGPMVQRTLADANDKDVDVLTAIAELPELVQSIVDGALLIKKMLVSFKKKELFLHAGTSRRANEIERQARSSKRFMSMKQWKASGGHPYGYHHARKQFINNNDRKVNAIASKFFLAEAQREVADAITSTWLNYRYNIMPTVYLMQDSFDAVLNHGAAYRSSRGFEVIDDEFVKEDGFVFVGENSNIQRCFIKREYKVLTNLEKLGPLIMSDILVTAFERIPLWSIIADWFGSFSTTLKAITWNPAYTQQAATASNRIKVDGVLKSVTSDEVSVRIKMDYYERITIPPVRYVRLYFHNHLDLSRKADLLAFAYTKSGKNSKKTYLVN